MELKIVFCIICFVSLLESTRQNGEKKEEVFVATNEWQVVKKGQKIPKGLHVRINFETSITEAKLLDPNEKEDKLNAITIPKNVAHLSEIGKLQSNNEKKPETNKFKTYGEIKQDLKDINLAAKTDFEVLTGLLEEYQKSQQDIAYVLRILEDLEYLAHQYDNALEFIRQDGFANVIHKSLNSTSDEVKAQALILMGSLAQNNPKVQIHAVETGSLNVLRLLMQDKNKVIKYRTVFALGSVLRRFPWAQLKFLETGGLVTLMNCLDSGDIKLQLKIVTLLNDLIQEQELSVTDEGSNEHFLQYRQINFKAKLVALGYCESLAKVFINGLSFDKEEFESDGKLLCETAMEVVGQECIDNDSESLISRLVKMKKESLNDDDVHKAMDSMMHNLKNVNIKEEL